MRAEPSRLAQLVIAYRQRFGRHVPETALCLVDAGALAAHLQESLANGVPLSESGWDCASPTYSLRGCIVRYENLDDATPTKGPDGESVQ